MTALTNRQAQIVAFICKFKQEQGYPPTRMEISDAFGFRSANAVQDHLMACERKGVLRLSPGIARGIVLT